MKTYIKRILERLKIHVTFYSVLSVAYLAMFIHGAHVGRVDLNLMIISLLLFRLHELKLVLKHVRLAALDILEQIRKLRSKKDVK